MFVDELEIYAKAGNGGDGVVRWRQEKYKPKAGPAGGNGGNGGDVYVRAVRDFNRLAKYTGDRTFKAQNGEAGGRNSRFGKGSADIYVDIPVGSTVTDLDRDRSFELTQEGDVVKILKGGQGGLGNEYFKSSTNTSPTESTKGKVGEEGRFKIEVSLIADVGLVGLPNAGKSTLLNTLTNARSEVGSYPFTTLEPHLGSFYGYALADIPGLISGAAMGKGLGHKFLRHIEKTSMLLHLVSLADDDPKKAYYTTLEELTKYGKKIDQKEQWIIFTKKDLVNKDIIDAVLNSIDTFNNRVFVLSCETGEGVDKLRSELASYLSER